MCDWACAVCQTGAAYNHSEKFLVSGRGDCAKEPATGTERSQRRTGRNPEHRLKLSNLCIYDNNNDYIEKSTEEQSGGGAGEKCQLSWPISTGKPHPCHLPSRTELHISSDKRPGCAPVPAGRHSGVCAAAQGFGLRRETRARLDLPLQPSPHLPWLPVTEQPIPTNHLIQLNYFSGKIHA